MKKRPQALIFSGYGLNCEEETKFAFEKAGADAHIVHINDLIDQPSLLKRHDIVALPGGFSYGDHLGSGRAYGLKLNNHLHDALRSFIERDTLLIGICNGFQILTSAGLLPGTLLPNATARYSDRWVDLKVVGESPWLTGLETLSLPIAHGEGRYYVTQEELRALQQKKAIALSYTKGEICAFQNLPANPNGALADTAGVLGHNGRVLGLMPHPERAISFFQLPHWTFLKEDMKRKGLTPQEEGPGLALFRNAVRYFA
jgi:phosphoribosylformylglycinamidine synthase subunit PurQ / glutaminase